MILVLDTNVVVAAMRSPSGASAEILRQALGGHVTLAINLGLALEYESVCKRAEHIMAAGLTSSDVIIFVNAVIAMMTPVETYFLWRPLLHDPADEMVLEAAINGHASAIVTFNQKDYGDIPLQFGVIILTPSQALGRIKNGSFK